MNPTTPSPRDSRMVDDIVLGYLEWREKSAAVWDAYEQWASASGKDKVFADTGYHTALDREEAAADSYAELIKLARDPPDRPCELPPLSRGPG